MRLNIGCGNNRIQGFVNIDKYDIEADIQEDICTLSFPENSIEEVVMYQVLEHIPWFETVPLLTKIHVWLKKGAQMTIEVPDLEVVCEKILKEGLTRQWHDNIYGGYHRLNDSERYSDYLFHKGSIHYQGFTFQRLKKDLEKAGFTSIERNSTIDKHPNYRFEENLSVIVIK